MAKNCEKMNWQDVRDLFSKWREENERRSVDVIQLWQAILEAKIKKIGKERHLILEQVIVAALDTSRFDIASRCIHVLDVDFPGSVRVMIFKAMRLEAMERFSEAFEVLNKIIAKDETNTAARKRKIAILIAQGQRVQAIKELTEYLKQFMCDQEAWQKLCNLYLATGNHSKAAFCMEEILPHNPRNHLVYQRLAEIRFTIGGMENIDLARTHFSQALKLNPNNLRALYGIYLCCFRIANSKALEPKRKEAYKTAQWALAEANEKTSKVSKIEHNDQIIAPLAKALDNLKIKS